MYIYNYYIYHEFNNECVITNIFNCRCCNFGLIKPCFYINFCIHDILEYIYI